MAEMKKLHALILKQQYDWLEDYSTQHEISIAEAVRQALSQFRYSIGKRETLEINSSEIAHLMLDEPTPDEESLPAIADRLMRLEIAVHKLYHGADPSGAKTKEILQKMVPTYMKL